MKLKIFTKPDCPKCPMAKVLGIKLEKDLDVEWIDCSKDEGLAVAKSFGILAVPTMIIVDESSKEIKSWRGDVPAEEEVRDAFGKA